MKLYLDIPIKGKHITLNVSKFSKSIKDQLPDQEAVNRILITWNLQPMLRFKPFQFKVKDQLITALNKEVKSKLGCRDITIEEFKFYSMELGVIYTIVNQKNISKE